MLHSDKKTHDPEGAQQRFQQLGHHYARAKTIADWNTPVRARLVIGITTTTTRATRGALRQFFLFLAFRPFAHCRN